MSSEVFGGPTPPPNKIPANDIVNVPREERLEQISPLIDDIEIKVSETTVEVFIEARAMTDCYDKSETLVTLKGASTKIIPHRTQSKTHRNCKHRVVSYREKVAELDAADPASRHISVLGFRGWHDRVVDLPLPKVAQADALPSDHSSSSASSHPGAGHP